MAKQSIPFKIISYAFISLLLVVLPVSTWFLLAPESWTQRAFTLALVMGYYWFVVVAISWVVKEMRKDGEL